MSSFQDTREQAEQKVMFQLLMEIERNPYFTQRNLAAELGIALGLMNQYLKRCVTKGWIRVSQLSPKRISYFLTPEGFTEKSKMVAGYLIRSLSFFRNAKQECEDLFESCLAKNFQQVALVGKGDLADIALLVCPKPLQLTVVSPGDNLSFADIFVITDIHNPQGTYDLLSSKYESAKILTLKLLHISR